MTRRHPHLRGFARFRIHFATRTAVAAALLPGLAALFLGNAARAQTYTFYSLANSSYQYGAAEGYNSAGTVGNIEDSTTTTRFHHAAVWTGTTGSSVHDLNTSAYKQSFATGTTGSIIVGYGSGATDYADHALTWGVSGTTYTVHDITPSGWDDAWAQGISGTTVVGYGDDATATGGNLHALAYTVTSTGTLSSYVDVAPTSGFTDSLGESVSTAVATYALAGYGITTGGATHALASVGTGITALSDINPTISGTTWTYSEALGVFSSGTKAGQTVVVGYGATSATGPYRALRWVSGSGSTWTATNMSPSGFTDTYADGVSAYGMIGYGEGTATGGNTHALLWKGTTASSYIDLNTYLPSAFTSTYVNTYATAIDANGDIVGYGTDANGVNAAAFLLMLTGGSPAPEPGGLALAGFAVGGPAAIGEGVRRLSRRRQKRV